MCYFLIGILQENFLTDCFVSINILNFHFVRWNILNLLKMEMETEELKFGDNIKKMCPKIKSQMIGVLMWDIK